MSLYFTEDHEFKIADADELSSLMDEAKYKEYCEGL